MLKLIDFLLLNAHSTQFKGLYQGKTGIALCLFEIARRLNNERTEDFAFELLQESLALSNKSTKADINFENGLSGVGFTLLYLIENRFLDADFEELFGEQTTRIQSSLKEKGVFPEKDLFFVYFLELLSLHSKKKSNFTLRNNILNDVGKSLKKQLKALGSPGSGAINFNVLNQFDKYLKVASLCVDYAVPESLLNQYLNLYKRERIACCFSTGYYLERMFPNKRDALIAKNIQESATQNIHLEGLTLAQRIDLLYLLNEADEKGYEKQIQLLEKDLFDCYNPLYEKQIIQSIPPKHLIAGYGSGIARLLLYWVYRENKRNRQDCFRFKYLF